MIVQFDTLLPTLWLTAMADKVMTPDDICTDDQKVKVNEHLQILHFALKKQLLCLRFQQ